MGGEPYSDDTNSDDKDFHRRSVLKAVGAATGTGLVGASAVQPASAGDDDPGTFLELQNCSSVFSEEPAPEDFPRIDVTGDTVTERNVPEGVDEVVFYYVGYTSTGQISDDQAYTLQRTLRANGYDAPVVTIQWEADTTLFSTAVDNADRDGRKVADYLRDYRARNPDTFIQLTGLSLGGRPPLATLDDLDGDVEIENVAIFGASVEDDAPCGEDSDPFSATAIENTAGRVYNYHSERDDTICNYYELSTIKDGLGCVGLDCGWFDGDAPDNWVDRDVTDQIDSHCNYQVPDIGVGNYIAVDLQSRV